MQAAFKRPGGNDGTTSQGAAPAAPRCGVDWDDVKAEDKTLVHQVLSPCPSPTPSHNLCIAQMHLHTHTTIATVVCTGGKPGDDGGLQMHPSWVDKAWLLAVSSWPLTPEP
jgi:hypothetical protein